MSHEPYPVAILAGGLATRLYPVTQTIPKSLVDVGGQPFIAHQLNLLRREGIRRVILCVGHLGHLVRDEIGTGEWFDVEVDYSDDGGQLLGTAGAIRKALPKLGDAFFVMYGDSYLPCTYAEIQDEFARCGRLALMTVFRNDGRWDQSNVEFENQEIRAYDKRAPTPRMRYIDYGLGVFRREAFDTIPEGVNSDLAELYRSLLSTGNLGAREVLNRFYEIGSFAGLEETRQLLGRRAQFAPGRLG